MKALKTYNKLVRKCFEIKGLDISGNKTRYADVILIKACIINVLHKYYGNNTVEIGFIINRHHSTVIHHLRKHVDRYKQEDAYAELYTTLSEYVMQNATAPMDVDGIVASLRSCLSVN